MFQIGQTRGVQAMFWVWIPDVKLVQDAERQIVFEVASFIHLKGAGGPNPTHVSREGLLRSHECVILRGGAPKGAGPTAELTSASLTVAYSRCGFVKLFHLLNIQLFIINCTF